jgi:hypothetical protein
MFTYYTYVTICFLNDNIKLLISIQDFSDWILQSDCYWIQSLLAISDKSKPPNLASLSRLFGVNAKVVR